MGVGALIATGCAATSGGICTAGAPGLISAGGGLGASIGGFVGHVADARDQIVHSVTSKIRDWTNGTRIGRWVKGLVYGASITGPTSTPDETGMGAGVEQAPPAPKGEAAKKKDEEQRPGNGGGD